MNLYHKSYIVLKIKKITKSINTEVASLRSDLETKLSHQKMELGKVSNLVNALDAKVSGAKKAADRLKHFPKVNKINWNFSQFSNFDP